MIFTITMIFFILNIIFIALFMTNHDGLTDKWWRDTSGVSGPHDMVFVAGFSPFPFLNILVFCYIFSKYHKYSKEK